MSGDVSDKKRLVSITEGCLRSYLIYLSRNHDFFPDECYGGPGKGLRASRELTLLVDGLGAPVVTDIPTEARNGRPRDFFRKRAWVREFFEKHNIGTGDIVAIERTDRPLSRCSRRRATGLCGHPLFRAR